LLSYGVRLDYPRNGFRTPIMTVYDDRQAKTPTDTDLFEPSPSTGARRTAAVFHAVYGLGDPEPRATCNPDDDVLKDFFGVSS